MQSRSVSAIVLWETVVFLSTFTRRASPLVVLATVLHVAFEALVHVDDALTIIGDEWKTGALLETLRDFWLIAR